MLRHSISILAWLLDLFNAPSRASMSLRQKAGRILSITGTIVVLCILAAMAGEVGIYVVQRVNHAFDNIPDLWNTAAILIGGLVVNALCVFILFQVKKFDRNLMSGTGEMPTRP